MGKKSAWKTVSVQDCGCLNQQKNAFSTMPGPIDRKIRVQPCREHAPAAPMVAVQDDDSGNYFDNYVDGRGF